MPNFLPAKLRMVAGPILPDAGSTLLLALRSETDSSPPAATIRYLSLFLANVRRTIAIGRRRTATVPGK